MPKIIIANQGDCFINICQQEGFFWETIWNRSENQELRQKRKKLNILKEGDQIYIPDRQIKQYSKPTEQEHVFVLKGTPITFTLTLKNLGKPRANEDYLFSVDGSSSRRGRTDKSGTLRETIPPDARYGTLLLGEYQEQFDLNFGYVDPIEEVSGIKTRLQNLGFYKGDINNDLDPETTIAIAEFQHSLKLTGEGDLTDETRHKLIQVHGS